MSDSNNNLTPNSPTLPPSKPASPPESLVSPARGGPPPSPPPPLTPTSSLLSSSLPKTRVPFYKNGAFLIGFFIFLLIAIPAVVYFGVKRQQSLTGQAQLAGCCTTDSDCRSWEKCIDGNGACTSNKSCRSTAGCSQDSDCIPPNKCINNNCSTEGGGGANITCSVGAGGVTFTNVGGAAGSKKVTGEWCQSSRNSRAECEAANNNYECRSTGPVEADSGILQPGESKTVGVGQISCGIWQIDKFTDCSPSSAKGCTWDDATCNQVTPTNTPPVSPTATPTGSPNTPTLTPTIPPSGQCRAVAIYDTNWQRISNLSTLKAGQNVRLAVSGSGSGFDHGRFRVNGGSWLPNIDGTTQTSPQGEFYVPYIIPAGVTSFRIEAMVHHPSLGWK